MKRMFFITFLLQGIFISLLSFGLNDKFDSDFASVELEDAFDLEEDFSKSDDDSNDFKFGGFGPATIPDFVELAVFSNPKEASSSIFEGGTTKSNVPLFILHCSLKVDC